MTLQDTPLEHLLLALEAVPFLTADLPPVAGVLKTAPEDFEVEELPAYLPSGEGEHLYLWIEKRGLNTHDAARALARAIGTSPDGVGIAGLKDRNAITRQWLSFHHPQTPDAKDLELPGLRVLNVTRHGNKLRTGHLKGNRFRLRLAGTPPEQDAIVREALARIEAVGLPNYFGAQRFGRDTDNLRAAHRWIVEGERAPGPPFLRKLFVSALQSALFNVWLGDRVAHGGLAGAVTGDLMRKEDSGGMFVSASAAEDGPRVQSWEISATGPMFGARMRAAETDAGEIERALLARFAIPEACFERVQKAGEGTRRVARIRPTDVVISRAGDDLELAFDLPKGAYATVLVAELTKQRTARLAEDA